MAELPTHDGQGNQRPRLIAFYLPQFHEIPENNAWWGDGFTEWTNVRNAKPLFDGHDHPRQAGSLGEYDLTQAPIKAAQSELAMSAGIDGFCMYFYWFDGNRLLERPVDQWRADSRLLPYCLSWANEAWTRRWDGKDHDVLMPQTYPEGFEARFFADALPHFRAPHYITHDGKPVLVVHRADLIPSPKSFSARMRSLAVAEGLAGLYLVAAETKRGIKAERLGFDATAEFPPVGANTFSSAYLRPLKGLRSNFNGRLMSYDAIARRYMRRRTARGVRHPGVMPGWDNTARRGSSATVYVGATPTMFRSWVNTAKSREFQARGRDGFVFINAWNEWAEGAYLEPDRSNGTAYLDTLSGEIGDSHNRIEPVHAAFWRLPQLMSMVRAGAGSLLNLGRRALATAHALTRTGK